MSEITFALGIPHTPWIPERADSLSRLLFKIGGNYTVEANTFRIFEDREPNWSWSEKLWYWALQTEASHLVQLQDDVIVCEGFSPELDKMITCAPDKIIGLESVFDPGGTWYTTGDGLIGVGYVIPIETLRSFLHWRSKLRPGAIQCLNEDQMLGLYAFEQRTPIWHPVPTIIDHDVSIPSTYNNDRHSHRRPVRSIARGDDRPSSWELPATHNHVKRMYQATPSLCRRWVPGYSYFRYVEDSRP